MERRAFLALIASAPIAALAPLPKFLPVPPLAFHRDAFALVMKRFIELPTDQPITDLAMVDDYLCARTADNVCWVIDRDASIITTFDRD